jgi:hypothetical protein
MQGPLNAGPVVVTEVSDPVHHVVQVLRPYFPVIQRVITPRESGFG